MTILVGDCVEVMRAMPEASVDAVVCDPPYGLEFMGKEWDKLEPARNSQRWKGSERRLIGDGSGKGGEFEERMAEMPNYRPKRNAKCRNCGHYRFSGSPCGCPKPDWDHRANEHTRAMQDWHEAWAREALRVLKPGGHLLAFGGTRTHHRLACAVEDAGFEIRDSITWLYGSGFPKSLDVSKQIDKMAGAEREAVGEKIYAGGHVQRSNGTDLGRMNDDAWKPKDGRPKTTPATEAARKWEGWGTALKPASEPIVVARKPLAEKNVASQVLATGTGAINVDGCRVKGGPSEGGAHAERKGTREAVGGYGYDRHEIDRSMSAGRWPPNVLLSHAPGCRAVGTRKVRKDGGPPSERRAKGGFSQGGGNGTTWEGYADPDGTETVEAYECVEGCPVALLVEQSGTLKSNSGAAFKRNADGNRNSYGSFNGRDATGYYGDSGGASRFFPRFDAPFRYVAKASRAERNAGLEGMPERKVHPPEPNGRVWDIPGSHSTPRANHHPTVKPLALMRWLVRLVTPPGGTVLDPFAGSGTTLVAAIAEGVDAVGIEKDEEYAQICRARVAYAERGADDPPTLFADGDVSGDGPVGGAEAGA